jgi:hypothetical protein
MRVEVGTVEACHQADDLLRWEAPAVDDDVMVFQRIRHHVPQLSADLRCVESEVLPRDLGLYLTHTY